ncbi:MAG: hypothetical protein V4549_00310 [Bacteroidota bacterium]
MIKSKFLKGVAIYMVLCLLFQIVSPTVAFALTGGPAQPESSSFEPVGTSEMVDLFSGDYNYNIPLLDVGGYPVNISYHSGISMDQEASWVGLGWNINPGAINRSMRGLPDDFKGDKVKKEFNVKKNQTYGVNVGIGGSFAGFDVLTIGYSIGAKYNNYTGVGFEQSANIAFTAGEKGKPSGTVGLGLHSSADGLDISPSVSFSAVNDKKDGADTKFGASLGGSFNSRAGLKALTLNISIEQGTMDKFKKSKDDKGNDVYAKTGVGGFEGLSNSIGTGCSYSYGNPTYIPSISMPMKNLSITTSFKTGITLFTFDGTLNASGYYSEQKLATNSDEVPAYGYMYSHEGGAMDKVMLDFNREKDGAFTKNTPCLPLTNYSYDLFSVSGQGVGGMFRPFRGDLGYIFDSRANTTSDSYSLGVELGSGNLSQGGGDITITDVNSTSGKWAENNKAAERLKFRKTVENKPLYEPYYFKEAGEKNVDSYSQLYTDIGEAQPVRIGLENLDAYEVKTKNTFVVGTDAGSEMNIPTTPYREERQRRNQLFSFINKEEYSKTAIDDDLNALIYPGTIEHNNSKHIAEITTTKNDGTRYVYGLPAYNIKQKEVTFSLGTATGDVSTGLVDYFPGDISTPADNSIGNDKGLDNYYSSTSLPPYAHSYLLTAVLSPDYVDIGGNGLTPDDYGTYTKFSYEKTSATGNGVYNWRVPYSEDKANFNEGLKTGISDNQGNYVYGEKEIWILKKIETKNYVAVFETKNRADGFDVHDENGRIGDNTNKLLKKISLYSRPDYEIHISNLASATPIKEVHFVYDYSLCGNTLNNAGHADNAPYSSGLWTIDTECELNNTNKGKLTLKQIYFTYGNSNKARLSPYSFTYSDFNPDYNMKGYDRWGNYKRDAPAGLPNSEFPYTNQEIIPSGDPLYNGGEPNKTFAELFASAWTLTKVGLPSGGTIDITYESDDYAYVQDRQAMQMFNITSIGTLPGSSPTSATDKTLIPNLINGGAYLFFKLQTPTLVSGASTDEFYNKYIKGINDLYFRFLVHINGAGYDYVSGYASGIKSYGYATDASTIIGSSYTYGYIQLNNTTIEDNGGDPVNPITKAAIQFARINTPRQAYNYSFTDPDPEEVNVKDITNALADANMMENIIDAYEGANGALYAKGYGKDVTLNKCWVRLLSPNKKKLGGGLRVHKIKIKDDWGDMLDGTDNDDNTGRTSEYGQEYTYTIEENGTSISSGVASYEPLMGGDENPFRLPVPFKEELKLAADLDYFQEEPFGECFFPSATVGYSKVTVKNLQYGSVKRHATGAVVSEFYTAKDYPVIATRTPMDARPKKTGQLSQLLKLKVRDYLTASQGFSIELNDMHGRPKATWVYAEDKTSPISGVEYKYKTKWGKLDNGVKVINKDGSIQTAQIGVDYDFIADMREQKTEIVNAGMQLNLYAFQAGPIPVIIPPILPTFSSERTRLRTASTTKVINRFGLLEETIAYDLDSRVSTQNLAYDSETGEVVLTKTKNDFNDEMYSLNFPAHLAYDRMGPGYKNIGTVLTAGDGLGYTSATGKITTNPSNILIPGDEVELITGSTIATGRFWINEETSNDLYVIDIAGSHASVSGVTAIKIIRSGRRNQQGLPIGSFASLTNPIGNNVLLPTFDESLNILNAGASEYSEEWRTFCECGINPNEPGNPYIRGILGNWRAKKSYAFLSDRKQTKLNDNANIRKDGTYKFFRQFWTPQTSGNWTVPTNLASPSSDWTWTSEVTEYSPYGPELENKDALNRYSAAVYGYNNTLPIAVGSNTRYRQIAFDNFEDYDFDDCAYDHFSYETKVDPTGTGIDISNAQSHSGKRSIKVPAGTTVKVNKTLQKCTE